MKKITLFLLLLPLYGISQIQIGQSIFGDAGGDELGSSTSISSNGNIIAVGAPYNNGNGTWSGQVKVYQNIGEEWTQLGQNIEGNEYDSLGYSVSLSSDGNIFAVGLERNNNLNGDASGAVRVFENIGNVWTQIGEDIIGENSNDRFGSSLELSSNGNILAVGARLNSDNGMWSGHVRVYNNINGTWVKIGQDIDGEAEEDASGGSISIASDGNVIAIASTQNKAESNFPVGHVRVYKNISGIWTQLGEDIDGEDPYDRFGNTISLSSDGNILAIGNPGFGTYAYGRTKVLKFMNNSWIPLGDDIVGQSSRIYSGTSVSLSENGYRVAISAPDYGGNDSNTPFINGQVRVFDYINGEWIHWTDINGPSAPSEFGYSISLSSDGDSVLIGCPYYSGSSSTRERGSAKVYNINETNLSVEEVLNSNISTILYPNPTKTHFTIQFDYHIKLEKIKIYNTLGQLLLTSKKPTINNLKLTSGNYIVEISTNNGKIYKNLIIK